eukprot:264796-Hanusia_phi.AAC.2
MRPLVRSLCLLGVGPALAPAVDPGDDEAGEEDNEASGVLDEEGLGEEDVRGKHAHKLAADAHARRHDGAEAFDAGGEGVGAAVGKRNCRKEPKQCIGIRLSAGVSTFPARPSLPSSLPISSLPPPSSTHLYSLLEQLELAQEEGDDREEDRADSVCHKDHLRKRTMLPVQRALLQRAHRRLRCHRQQHHPDPSHCVRPLRPVPDLVRSREHVQPCDSEGGGGVLGRSKPLLEDDET